MRDHENVGKTGVEGARKVGRGPEAEAHSSQPGLLPLQATMGNAAVVQMLRRAGHPWAEEAHRHSAECGHDREGQSVVQRSAVHDVLRSPGRPLDGGTRADMEARFGADFSDVRVHDDSAARASAAEVGARAYTSGSHVVIGDGGGDRHTLAHELTHVVQQRRGPVAGTDNGAGLRVSDPSDRFEREAEANARRVLGGPAPSAGPAGAGRRSTARTHGAGPRPVQRTEPPKASGATSDKEEKKARMKKELVDHFTDFFYASDQYEDFDDLCGRYQNEEGLPKAMSVDPQGAKNFLRGIWDSLREARPAMEAGFVDFFYASDRYEVFNDLYYQYLDKEGVPEAASKEEVKDRLEGIWGSLQSSRNTYETNAQPMGDPTDRIRLYRKMSEAEANQITGARTPGAGINDAMNYNASDQHRKWFTTSLTHTDSFTNENAQNAGDEKVLEFTMSWRDYWAFYTKFGTPSQQTGAFDKRDSAVVHQERLRKGERANFKLKEQVDDVYREKTHHNIGIGHGNKADFIKMVTGIREVAPEEVSAAVAAARAVMKAALTART
ncbi:DUF4157 domain-containing protein [Streptomyces sp. NPDC015350]|uniref:eCIS core domain-containing protein n=1 Tax=Streptomyces sp. NPDC015350 TaxID=3364955 RepID=UPI0036F66AFA